MRIEGAWLIQKLRRLVAQYRVRQRIGAVLYALINLLGQAWLVFCLRLPEQVLDTLPGRSVSVLAVVA
ncbi:hypothetical protein AOA60_14275 [Pseudomonas sp. 2822-17]|nr:hypothetical protein AOA60_14275 [Pseudomonas sp. 2822-17]